MALSPSADETGVRPRLRIPTWFQGLLLILLGGWIFYPTLHGTWLWDDYFYLPGHPLLNDPARLLKTWFVPGSTLDYYPLQATIQWGQWELFGQSTLGYHVCNITLHILSAFLVWKLLTKLGLRFAWAGALLFLVHPVQVESVAYISEFKNTLSLPPFLIAMCYWIDFEHDRHKRNYWLAIAWFLIAMLCKVSMAPFPVVMLLYAWWKRGRVGWNDLKVASPFFIVSLVLGSLIILSGRWHLQLYPHSSDPIPLGGLLSRIACAGTTLQFYTMQCFWPGHLLPMYPQWQVDPPSPTQFIPWLALALVLTLFWIKRASWGRHGLLGLGFFGLLLAPFLGFLDVSYMRFTWVMDHFLYIPIIGMIGLVVAAAEMVADSFRAGILRPFLAAVTGAVITLFTLQSHVYAARFIDEKTLWGYTIQLHPGAWPAHNNLGMVYQRERLYPAAEAQYRETIRLYPADSEAFSNLGTVLSLTGRDQDALPYFEHSLQQNPENAATHYNMGTSLDAVGRSAEALQHYLTAIRIKPTLAEPRYSLGNAYAQKGDLAAAIEEYRKALALKPDYADAHTNLANCLLQSNRATEAIEEYAKALRLNPNDLTTRDNLGIAYMQTGQLGAAKAQFAANLKLDPKDETALTSLAKIEAYEKAHPSQ